METAGTGHQACQRRQSPERSNQTTAHPNRQTSRVAKMQATAQRDQKEGLGLISATNSATLNARIWSICVMHPLNGINLRILTALAQVVISI